MPELPEVQTTINGINRFAKNLEIVDAWTNYKSDFHTGKDNIKDPSFFKKFKKEIVGKKIIEAKRRAKNILIFLSDDSVILIHMKMTGHILYGKYRKQKNEWLPSDPNKDLYDPFNRFVRFVLCLSNGKHLVLSDMRRFAKVTHIHAKNLEKTLHLIDLGPEPLEKTFDLKQFKERLLTKPSGKIKQVLLDPKVIAGIGNIYSDEILWCADIHPERKIENLKANEFKKLFLATKKLLQKGIDFGGDSMSDYRNILGKRGQFQNKHEAYRRVNLPCRKKGCGGKIIRKQVGGRNAHFCNKHQK